MSAIGRRYRYIARAGRSELGGTGRYGQIITVLDWHRSRVLVEFPDGFRALTPGRCLRKLKK